MLIPFLFIYVSDSYDWEGDTALLIRQAENISTGKPFYESDFIYNSEFTLTSPAYYPPMTPLLFSGIHFFMGIISKKSRLSIKNAGLSN